jgi:hypothetical protein
MCAASAVGAALQSPTIDESAHLPAGLSHWQFGRFDLYQVNPHLVRTVAALPVIVAEPELRWGKYRESPFHRPEFQVGQDFIGANGQKSMLLFALGRWACLPFMILGGWICWRWSTELFGPWAGLVALGLWCFCPNLLGHGQLLSPDVPGAAMVAASAYSFRGWWREPTWSSALVAGSVLGLALLTKTTSVLLLGLFPLLWLLTPSSWWPRWRQVPQLLVMMLIGLMVLNVGYGFEGCFTKLGDYRFTSRALGATNAEHGGPETDTTGNRFAGTWLASIPVLLPENYVRGIDAQRRDFESGRLSYLCGEYRNQGWLHYYVYAMAVKMTLGFWLLAVLSVFIFLWYGVIAADWREELMILVPGLGFLAFVSSQTGFSHHLRYVFPAFPFLFIWISRVAGPAMLARRWLLGLVAGGMIWHAASCLRVYPHTLSYFNELAGGPENGAAHLLDSNIDWGQDLTFLKRWYDEHPEAHDLTVVYFGLYEPGMLYPQLKDLPRFDRAAWAQRGPQAGWYAISVNHVYGYALGGISDRPSADFVLFRHLRPVARAGYSIYIYHITEAEAARLRRELGFAEPQFQQAPEGGAL